MANQRQPDTSGFTAETDIDLVLGNANPNPTRTGCPSDDVLTALARRERSVDDPAYDHLTKCSPCYRRVRALQQGIGERRGSVAWRTWRLAAGAGNKPENKGHLSAGRGAGPPRGRPRRRLPDRAGSAERGGGRPAGLARAEAARAASWSPRTESAVAGWFRAGVLRGPAARFESLVEGFRQW